MRSAVVRIFAMVEKPGCGMNRGIMTGDSRFFFKLACRG